MEPQAWEEPCLSHPHDEVLDFWLSTGVIGLVAFLWMQAVFWLTCYRLWHNKNRTTAAWTQTLLAGSMAAMLASIVHGLVDNSYFLVDLATLFWLLCAFVSWVWWSSTHERSPGDELSP
jgi:O-antigen ligase